MRLWWRIGQNSTPVPAPLSRVDVFVQGYHSLQKGTLYTKWKAANPGEAAAYETFMDAIVAGGSPAVPVLGTPAKPPTPTGAGLVLCASAILIPDAAAPTPAPTPTPVPPAPVPVPVPPPVVTVPKYGLALGYRLGSRPVAARDAEIAQAVSIGAKLVRLDRPSDALTDLLLSKGIEMVYLLQGDTPAPGWVTPQAFGIACGQVAARLKGRVRFFEVLNEPDLHGYTPTTYGPYLYEAYKAIKQANPQAVVLHGGLWKWKDMPGFTLVDWVEGLYKAGFGYFDVMNVHAYDDPAEHGAWSLWDLTWGSGGAGFYDAKNVRSVMNAYGDAGKPIVSTESGGPLMRPSGGGWATKYTEAKQALIVQHALQAADGVGTGYRKTMFSLVYSLLDDDGDPAPAQYGLVRPDWSPRPSLGAFQAVAG